ncbi:MAG TPA: cytochrome bd-I oxidase subunit CydX [Chiayiivirga sp.]|jgi:cyd operon protein YbgT|uniref:Cytochrome bd-I oxidase subunit CydX n=1 Tax=Denitratimonas tolerans TaxID=1338420 RepID=A0AAW9RDI9_9GAMM|nr:cytochrome bd-I oxidase subunit CydX [Gammaproteobacteria bacterium]HRN59493.1 cytochrome bd-I oxidase subunit CydX [Chiayiivirga sp.]HRQ66282.1 cytochrome bd-I oxidase subunit CydX [Xanthomonadaceae bacterium]
MWYFTWILGVLMACFAGIINAMWLEFHGYPDEDGNDQY